MSHVHPSSASSPDFQLIFNIALKSYERRTKSDLLVHPLAAQLQDCNSPNAVLALILPESDERLTKWLNPTVNVLYTFSATLGGGVGTVFSPARVIFTGIGVLLLATMDVRASQDNLIDIFERMENFFRRLEIYTEVSPTPEMIDIIVKILVEVLSILAIATKDIKQGRTKKRPGKYLKKLVGRTDMEDALKRLEKLTNEEVRMATAQVLKVTHNVNDRVRGVEDKVIDVDNRVAGVDDRVARVDDKVAVVIDGSSIFTGNQLRQDFLRWLSPPDPSINHNIACGAHHKRTAEWFCQGSIFTEWKSNGSLLWLHGKRTFS
ncbi:hypothetical protein BGY98DRAFT_934155 [Russula aff. rugulosa BPL654]|nr:hypothetical protein BGY98DRAFT_934155 [Russula aff. rugulosa BPL654]